MKTVRSQVFETNSSSTHAVTLCVSHARKPSMKPYSPDNAPITVNISKWNSWEEESWTAKIQFLALYLKTLGRIQELEKCLKLISDFAGFDVEVNKEDLHKIPTESIEADAEELLGDHFSYFLREYYGHDSVEDFREVVEDLLSKDDTILAFICSTGWFDVQGYYDG